MENIPKAVEQEISDEAENPVSNWVKTALDKATLLTVLPYEEELAEVLIESAFHLHATKNLPLGVTLAASFDLFIAAEYYKSVANVGWYYCPEGVSTLFYPLTNVCPRCVLDGRFRFETANKPESGQIGQATSRLLAVFLHQLFKRASRPLTIYRGTEPVDILIYDSQSNIVLLAEVKAAPLTTPALATSCEPLQEIIEGNLVSVTEHRASTIPILHNTELFLTLPKVKDGSISSSLYSLGNRGSGESSWAYKPIKDLITKDSSFFEDYMLFWSIAYESYKTRNANHTNIFWLTNACGQPGPMPVDWKARGGKRTGYESVSDGKTSVGMDRTDDIKKGIYQVLKIGAESKPNTGKFEVKTALISNIHAVRHYSEYLTSLENVVWALEK